MENNIETEYIKIQEGLKNEIDLTNRVDLSSIKTVAGVDLAYWNKDNEEYAVCCIVILDFNSREIIEKKEYSQKISTPYIPGCLAFREIPLFTKTYEQLEIKPDILFFDGNGYLHPRHMGLATHAGILIKKPTVGIAKTYYKVENTDFSMPDNEKNAYTDIIINNEVYGRVLRTYKDVKSVFLSVGNMINLKTATKITLSMVTKESHIPMPTRLADIMTHEARKRYIEYIFKHSVKTLCFCF